MNEIKSGFHIKRNNTSNVLNDNNDTTNSASGWIPFSINIIIFIIVLLVGIFVSNDNVKWYHAWLIASIFSLSFNLFWWMGRKEYMSHTRFQLHLLAKKTRINHLKEKLKYKDYLSIKNFNNFSDFENYLKTRLYYTKNLYITSWIFVLVNILASVITILVFHYLV